MIDQIQNQDELNAEDLDLVQGGIIAVRKAGGDQQVKMDPQGGGESIIAIL